MTNWKAYHIFYHHFEKHDDLIQVIADKAREFIETQTADKWFFLRYWEGGPHVRVRFLNPSESVDHAFVHTVRTFIKNNPSPNALTRDMYYKNHLFDGEPVDIEKIGWHKEGEIKNYRYLPEYERYGGKELIGYSETMFMISSNIVDKILKGHKKFEMRMIYSTAINMIILKDIIRNIPDFPLREFFTTTIDFWSDFKLESEEEILAFFESNNQIISKVIAHLSQEQQINFYIDEMLYEFYKISRHVHDLNITASILGSHLHMTSNRLGISPGIERAILNWISQTNDMNSMK